MNNLFSFLDGDEDRVNSFLKVKGQIRYDDKRCASDESGKEVNGTSFLQINNLFISDVKQWKLIDNHDLSMVNFFLNTNYFAQTLSAMRNTTIAETFTFKNITADLSYPYEYALIELNFNFINSLWNGNSAYIMINDEVYWMEHHLWDSTTENASSLCDSEKWTTPIKISHKNLKKSHALKLNIKFGMKINKSLNQSRLDLIANCIDLKTTLTDGKYFSFDNLMISIK